MIRVQPDARYDESDKRHLRTEVRSTFALWFKCITQKRHFRLMLKMKRRVAPVSPKSALQGQNRQSGKWRLCRVSVRVSYERVFGHNASVLPFHVCQVNEGMVITGAATTSPSTCHGTGSKRKRKTKGRMDDRSRLHACCQRAPWSPT